VDKRDFFHKLKGLRALEAVAQTLFLAGIETGQKICRRDARQFRTFDPVDIQQLIHKRSEKGPFDLLEASLADVGQVSKSRACPESGKFFFSAGPQRSGRVVRFTTKSLYTE
jgi:hypothetical protein